ncbi:MAG TPA: LysM domain-containing protein [Actinomycetota bacterium]|nr:LysM domain-containing protein [Actinomycetota bacterium]
MGDRMTESFEPYRPESSYELDYDEEPARPPQGRVLWGRVVVLGVVLLLAFLLGRATGGGGETGVSEARYDEVVEERNDLRAEVAGLEADLEAAQEPTPEPTTSPAAPEDEAATDPEGETEGGETYIVQPNDTLASIAADQYGDASLDDFLAEANNITDPEALAVGTELIIPPKPE